VRGWGASAALRTLARPVRLVVIVVVLALGIPLLIDLVW